MFKIISIILIVLVFGSLARNAEAGNFVIPLRYSYISSWHGFGHTGIDFAAPSGTPIYAAKYGTVGTGWEWGGYGNYITIDSEGDHQVYAHLGSIAVWSGWVVTGQYIGNVGCTGRCTGPHLHYEVTWNGVQVDPRIPFGL